MLLQGVSLALAMALQAGTPAMRDIEPVDVRADLVCFYAIVQIPRTTENAAPLNAGIAHFQARVRTQLTAVQFDQMLRTMIMDGSMAQLLPPARNSCYQRAAQVGLEMIATGRMLSDMPQARQPQP